MAHSIEEAKQILTLAIERRQNSEFSQQDLSELASKLNITAEELKLAEVEWLVQRRLAYARRSYLARRRRQTYQKFKLAIGVLIALIALTLIVKPRDSNRTLNKEIGWGIALVVGVIGFRRADQREERKVLTQLNQGVNQSINQGI